MNKHKDSNKKELIAGDVVTYDPSLDANEEMFGEVPERFYEENARITSLPSSTVAAMIQFLDGKRIYKVATAALVFVSRTSNAAPAKPTPKKEAQPTTQHDTDEEESTDEDGDEAAE